MMPLEFPEKPKSRDSRRHEVDAFLEKYEMYSDIYGDPVERMFEVMAQSQDLMASKSAAEILMSYRFPRIKAVEDRGRKGQTFQFIVAGPKQPKAIDASVVEVKALPATPDEDDMEALLG